MLDTESQRVDGLVSVADLERTGDQQVLANPL